MDATLNDNGYLLSLPEGIAERCQRVYGWNTGKTSSALLGYRQFIKLKLQQEDYNARILSPSIIIDQVWHQHILDVAHYVEACKNYTSGKLIGHNPDGMLDVEAKKQRIQNTKLCLKTLYGKKNIHKEVWNFGEDDEEEDKKNDDNSNAKRKEISEEEDEEESDDDDDEDGTSKDAEPVPKKARSSSKNKNPSFQIRICDQSGKETFFTIKRTTRLQTIVQKFINKEGGSPGCYRFMIDGAEILKTFGADATVEDAGLEEDDQIDCWYEMGGGLFPERARLYGFGHLYDEEDPIITVRVRDQTGELTFFKIKKNMPLRRLFYKYAAKRGLHREKCRFMVDGERIEDDDTPRHVDLQDQDVVDCLEILCGC